MLTPLVVLGAALIGFLAWRWFPPRHLRETRHLREKGSLYFIQEAKWEEKILLMTRGNRGALERAVTARRRKFPNATRLELLKLVHDEYVKDRE